MALTLMYITNKPEIARIAENAGVDRIFVDMEYIGKEKRQSGLDTVKSRHTIDDVKNIRKALTKAQLLVRINPIHCKTDAYTDSKTEIDAVIEAGADVVMLPMYKTADEVERFLEYVNGRATTQLLAETPEACDIMDSVVQSGADEIHIGLNDLHLAMHKKFMFELLTDGTVDKMCGKMKQGGKKYGFGGIARIGHGMLPSEYVIKEHYRLGSGCAILSRSFCNAEKIEDMGQLSELFNTELVKIRKTENAAAAMSAEEYEANRTETARLVGQITASL